VDPARGLKDRMDASFGEDRESNHGYKRAFGPLAPAPAGPGYTIVPLASSRRSCKLVDMGRHGPPRSP
jgi:hypothetical protein